MDSQKFRKENTDGSEPIRIRVNKLALNGFALAAFGLLLAMPGLINMRARSSFRNLPIPSQIVEVMFLISLFAFPVAFVMGIASLISIEKSGGRIMGRKFAIGSILIPVFTFIFTVWSGIYPIHRCVAFRMVCGTNLSGIGKAMLIYANDYNDEMPRAGGPGATLARQIKYDAIIPPEAYSSQNGTDSATISSSLYLLVKYSDVQPKHFICKGEPGDKGVTEYKPPKNTDLIDLWDFGSEPWKHVSFAYHMPYCDTNGLAYPLTTSSDPGMAVAADRNPWIPSVGWKTKKFTEFNPDGDKSLRNNGNTPCHQNEGQNIMYLDTHVNFENVSTCGINDDNIYTLWNRTDIRRGQTPVFGSVPQSRTDSLLVNDFPIQKK